MLRPDGLHCSDGSRSEWRSPAARSAAVGQRPRAPVDLTGYWVTVVTEDWRYRMVTPARGDHPSVPLNAAGNALANTLGSREGRGGRRAVQAYGAAGVMRAPGRLHVTWQDDATLKIETEAGTQTRLLRFGRRRRRPPSDAPSAWQGQSVARGNSPAARAAAAAPRAPAGPRAGNLKVVTTRMRPGYLQKNGVPYSGNAVLTEYFSRTIEPNGDSWLILTSIVDDPQYLTGPFIRSTHYKTIAGARTRRGNRSRVRRDETRGQRR